MKKSSKQYGSDEVERYLGALQEENRGYYKVIGERLEGVHNTLESHTEMIGSLLTDMTQVKVRLGTAELTMNVIQEDINFIKSNLKRKVDQEEFDALIRRVSLLEKRVLK